MTNDWRQAAILKPTTLLLLLLLPVVCNMLNTSTLPPLVFPYLDGGGVKEKVKGGNVGVLLNKQSVRRCVRQDEVVKGRFHPVIQKIILPLPPPREEAPRLKVRGIMTHFISAQDSEGTLRPLRRAE